MSYLTFSGRSGEVRRTAFVFSFSLFFVSVPCARLSWPFCQLLSARKYTVSYRIADAGDMQLCETCSPFSKTMHQYSGESRGGGSLGSDETPSGRVWWLKTLELHVRRRSHSHCVIFNGFSAQCL